MQKKSMSNSLANPLIDSAKKHVPLSHSFSDQLSDHVSIDSDDPLLANSHADSVVHFNECLQGLNMYMDSRAGDKQQVVVMLEIPAVGNTTYRTMSLRQLLSYIDEEVAKFELNKSLNKGDAPEPVQGASHHSHGHHSHQYSVRSIGRLQYRDLRRLEYQFNPHEEPMVMVRKHAVIFSFTPLRAIVLADRLLFVVPNGADSLLRMLENHMRDWAPRNQGQTTRSSLRSATGRPSENAVSGMTPLAMSMSSNVSIPSPMDLASAGTTTPPLPEPSPLPTDHSIPVVDGQFESQCYEALLATIIALQTRELDKLSIEVGKVLFYFRNRSIMSLAIQEQMRLLKSQIQELCSKINANKRKLVELLEDSMELTYMNVSATKMNPLLYAYAGSTFCSDPRTAQLLTALHENMEILFESYMMDYNSLESKAEHLRAQLQNAEESILLRLDTSRNQLLVADTILQVITLCVACGSLVGSFYGMNLVNHSEDSPHLFATICILTVASMAFLSIMIIYIFVKKGILPSKLGRRS